MTKLSGKKAGQSKKAPGMVDNEREFSKIKEGIKHNQAKIAEFLRQRVGPGDWELKENNVQLEDDGGNIDMIFVSSDGKKEKYILVDVSVPHLGLGQKYLLPTQAKIFQKMREVPATRVKKAIILVRKGTETLSLQTLKVRCPIIEIQLENIIRQVKPTQENLKGKVNKEDKNSGDGSIESKKTAFATSENNERQDRSGRDRAIRSSEEPKNNRGFSSLPEELLYALKEAIVHESLSTTYKRSNKYIRRGLWHWIEREIMDPNVHFFLIILSSIYQSKTGEILSKKFRTVESYTENPENVVNAIFSRENAPAEEIRKNSERHKKALNKFLCCFSAQPPFEYLKSLFLKEFRSSGDGLKSRMSVYTTLTQLLVRCGFEGEKEVNYPLEILDELKIFQGVLCGNYEILRTDNASKKLKHLVPQIDWEPNDVYALREQISKVLNLPAVEFNLNAYLPQAFLQDAKNMVETRKEALRQHNASKESKSSNRLSGERYAEQADSTSKMSRQERMALQKQIKQERQNSKRRYDDEYMPKKHHAKNDIDMPMLSENGDFLSEEVLAERNNDSIGSMNSKLIPTEMNGDEVKRILDDPYAFTKPTSLKKVREEREEDRIEPLKSEASEETLEEPTQEEIQSPVGRELPRERNKRSRYAELDESRHRHFENYGGIDEEDPDVIRLGLAMAHQEAKSENNENETENDDVAPTLRRENNESDFEAYDSAYEEVPTKSMLMQGYRPSATRNEGRRHGNFYRSRQGNGSARSGDRSSQGGSNRSRSNGSSRTNSSGYREHKKYHANSRNANRNGNFRRSRRDGGNS